MMMVCVHILIFWREKHGLPTQSCDNADHKFACLVCTLQRHDRIAYPLLQQWWSHIWSYCWSSARTCVGREPEWHISHVWVGSMWMGSWGEWRLISPFQRTFWKIDCPIVHCGTDLGIPNLCDLCDVDSACAFFACWATNMQMPSVSIRPWFVNVREISVPNWSFNVGS